MNGVAAVLGERELPQIILMDRSPHYLGPRRARRIRQQSSLKDVPIIAYPHTTHLISCRALVAGCAAYITKPIDYGELEFLSKVCWNQHS